jgi:hypothetical protein
MTETGVREKQRHLAIFSVFSEKGLDVFFVRIKLIKYDFGPYNNIFNF